MSEAIQSPPKRPEVKEPRPLPSVPTAEQISTWLVETMADHMEVSPSEIDVDEEFAAIGIDSITALNMTGELAEAIGTDLHQTLFWDYPDIPSLSRYLATLFKDNVVPSEAPCDVWKDRALQSGLTAQAVDELRERIATWDLVSAYDEGMLMVRPPERREEGTPVFWVGGCQRSLYVARFLGRRPFYILPTGLGIVGDTLRDVQALAKHYTNEILSVHKEGPVILGGYCFGSAIALEIARDLQQRGKKVASLVVLEWPGPSDAYRRWYDLVGPLYSTRTRHDYRRVARHLKERGVSDAFRVLRERIAARSQLSRQPAAANGTGEGQAPRVIVTRLEVPRSARWKYVPKPIRVPAIVITGRQSALYSNIFPRIGWEKVLTGPTRYAPVPGDHFSMLKGKGAEAIGRILRSRFRRIDGYRLSSSQP